MKQVTRRTILAAAPAVLTLAAIPARAQKKYGPGVTDAEINVGNTGPYSGPASSYSPVPKSIVAWCKMVNDQGGVNGRKINLLSYDDAYTPPKTVEQIRKLVEQDEVLCTVGTLGTPTNSAIWQYMNQKKVPQLFVATGATKWDDPKGHPWTIGWQPNYQSEGRIYAAYLLQEKPNGKIGVLYQNDDFGKDYLKGLKDGLGEKKSMIAVEASYETTDPQWKDDAGFKEWSAFMDKYLPDGDKLDAGNVAGASLAAMTVQVLKQCGDELTRENVMKQAANLHDVIVPMLLPGIKANTSPTDFAPLKQVQMARFTGERWELFGPLITGAVT